LGGRKATWPVKEPVLRSVNVQKFSSEHVAEENPKRNQLTQDQLGEMVPEENFWILRCKGRLTEADTLTIGLGATPSGLSSAHLHHPHFLHAGCPSCRPTNSAKALKATSTFGLGKRC